MIFKMGKRKIFILLIIFIAIFLYGDRSNEKGYKIDFIQSIEQLSTKEDKIETLIKLARFHLHKHRDYDKSIELLLKAQDLNNPSLMDSTSFQKKDGKSSNSKYISNKIMISILLSNNYIEGGLKYKSLETLNTLLNLKSDKNISKDDLSYIYITTGKIYSNLKLYNKSLTNFLKALEIIRNFNNSQQLSLIYHLLAVTETRLNNLPKALEYYSLAEKIFTDKKIDSSYNTRMNNIGDIYEKQFKFDLAKEYYLKSLKINEKNNNKNSLALNYINLASVLIKEKKYKEAKAYLIKGDNYAKISNNKDLLKFLYLEYYGLYSAINDFKNKDKYYNILRDLSEEKDKIETVTKIEATYNLNKTAFEKELIEIKLQSNKYKFFVTISVLSIIILVLFFLFLWKLKTNRLKQVELKKENIQSQLTSLKALINPHFLFNSLNSISGILNNEPKKAKESIRNISTLLRYMLVSSKKDKVDLKNEIDITKRYLEVEKIRFEERLNYKFIIDDSVNLKEIEIPPLLLQPLVENSIKYTVSKLIEGGEIEIIINLINDKQQLEIIVRDSGNGVPDIKKISFGFGMSSITERLNLIYGKNSEFTFKNLEPSGFENRIVIPVNRKI